MSAETLMKNDLLMRQGSSVGVEETSETSLLNENLNSLNNNKNSTASSMPIDGSYLFLMSFCMAFILTLILLFRFKNPLQFYVKYTVYVCITMSYSMLCIPYALLRPNNARNIEWVSKNLTWLFKIFKVNVTLENAKYLQINQPYILINNHQSSLDFLTMMKVWPGGNCTPLAKKELMYSGPFGVAIWLCGITFIDRLNPEKSRGTITKLADKINKDNMRVWIFPEGTRSAKTELLPFKKGAFHLAIQAQIPIVCMVTSSYLNFYSKKEKKFLFDGQVKVRVLPPFQTKGMTPDSVNQLTKHLQDIMQKEYDLLNKEINLNEKYYTKKVSLLPNLDESVLSNLDKTMDSDKLNQTQNDDNNNSINEEDIKKYN